MQMPTSSWTDLVWPEWPRGLSRLPTAHLVRQSRERNVAFMDAHGKYDDETMDAVDAFRKAHGLEHAGNPRGLVDGALVQALRRAYQALPQATGDDPAAQGP